MKKLKEVLAQNDTVIFVGSGISLWSGLPTWSKLIDMLALTIEENGENASLVHSEKDKGDLLQAASYGFSKLSKHQIGEFIKKACNYGKSYPHEIHRKIVNLGPRCFITTNYDDLLEQSLRLWQPERFYRPPITNRHLTETAEIVHARATDYIFKPHGDAGDIESIVLTREQYRKLMPLGERYSALETLKMIMTTRPIIYLGFGLRDPDFLYLRDLLANTFNGGIRDHYAIMSDTSSEEITYWRNSYGIHLVNYDTIERGGGSKDHTPLLSLLDELLIKDANDTSQKFDPASNNVVLALARYASGLSRAKKLEKEFEIRVHAKLHKKNSYQINSYDGTSAEKFLCDGPKRALLIGSPGAGKTYAISRAIAALGNDLTMGCLAEQFNSVNLVIPVFADMKLYKGDIENLVRANLPTDLPLEELLKYYNVKIFIDSFNEMPREFWESGAYEADFEKFKKRTMGCSLIIGSRTNDGLDKLNFDTYNLDQISKQDVENELYRLGVKLDGRFAGEMKALLQRPFYFQYIISGKVSLPQFPQPKDFYTALFANINNAFFEEFKINYNFETPLSLVAYETLNRGDETFPLGDLMRILRTDFLRNKVAINAKDASNWLISYSVLIPYANAKISFVHQTITEYLAAKELARQYSLDNYILQEKLTLTRWDQTLFLTLSMLSDELSGLFLNEIIEADFPLALNATKYIEFDRDRIVSKLLAEIPRQMLDDDHDWKLSNALSRIASLDHSHECQLREIIELKDSLGGAAAKQLIDMKGVEIKDEMLYLIYESADDFNFCNDVGHALKEYANENDLKQIAIWTDKLFQEYEDGNRSNDEDAYSGFTSGMSDFLEDIDISTLKNEFLPATMSEANILRVKIVCHCLWNGRTADHLALAGELLLAGFDEAIFAIYIIGKYAGNYNENLELGWATFKNEHIDKLVTTIDFVDRYSLGAISTICENVPELRMYTRDLASKMSGFKKVSLLNSLTDNENFAIFEFLNDLISKTTEEREKLPIHFVEGVPLDWKGKEALFENLLRLRDVRILSVITDSGIPCNIENLSEINFGDNDWWIDWLAELSKSKDSIWNARKFGSIIAKYCDKNSRLNIIEEFNSGTTPHRRMLQFFVLPYMEELSTNDFNENSISYLLAELQRETADRSPRGFLLATTATESFVNDRLLPLLVGANEELTSSLKKVLRQAGPRHGRRYF